MMITRCPACATRFRVTPAQLRARNGKVRCGRCSTAFDGLAELLEDADQLLAPASPTRATPTTPAGEEPASAAAALAGEAHATRTDLARAQVPAGPVESVDILLEAEAPENERAAPAEPPAQSPEPLLSLDAVEFGAAVPPHGVEPSPTAAPAPEAKPVEPEETEANRQTKPPPPAVAEGDRASRDSGLDDLLAALAATSKAAREPASSMKAAAERDADAAAEPIPTPAAVELAKPEAPKAEPPKPEPSKPEPSKPRKRGGEQSRAEASPAPPEVEPAPGTPPVPEIALPPLEPPRPRKALTFLWALLALVGLAGLAAQAIYTFRGELAARYPQVKPLLEQACQRLGCKIPLLREPALLGIESSDLHPVPSRSGGLELVASLRNRAPYPLAYPHLELTLTDVRDQPLLRRVFTPPDYAPAGADLSAGFAPGTTLSISLQLQAEEVGASGYRIYVFYP